MLRKSLLLHRAIVLRIMGPRWTFWGEGREGVIISHLQHVLASNIAAGGTLPHRLLGMLPGVAP